MNADLTFVDYFDPAFQELLLAVLCRNKDFTAKARGILEPKYFAGQVYRDLLQALWEYWDANHAIPPEDVLLVLHSKRADDQTTRQAYAEVAKRIFSYEDEELDHAFVQDELLTFVCRAQAAVAVAGSWREVKTFDIAALHRKLESILRIPILFAQLGASVRKDWGMIFDDEGRTQFPTGWPTFDKALRGGAREGELVVIMAPLKRGKSLVLINIGRMLAGMGCIVVHYTLEMYERDVLKRYLASFTNRPANHLTDYEWDLRQLHEKLATFTDGDVIIKEFPGKTATVEMVEAHLRMVAATHGGRPVVPIIDYADLLKIPGGMEQWMALEEVYISLRNLGRRLGVPIITASQTNATGFNAEELDASHQSASTRKGFVADFMFGVQQSKIDYSANRFTMVPFLNRHERKDMISHWRAWYDCSRIDEISEEEFLNLQPNLGLRLRRKDDE